MQEEYNNEEQQGKFPIFPVLSGIGVILLAFLFFSIGGEDSSKIEVPDQYKTDQAHAKEISYEAYKAGENINRNIKFNKQFNYKYDYTIHIEGTVNNIVFRVPLPNDSILKQQIINRNVTPTPHHVYVNDGNIIAEYKYKTLNTSKNVISVQGSANVNNYDIKVAKLFKRNLQPETNLSRFLGDDGFIQPSNSNIKKIANSISGNNREEIVQNIYNYTRKNIQYSTVSGDLSASQALKKGKGKCGEFASVMASLCRAKNIPARIITGNIARDVQQKHTWVEVYFDEYGWVTYDPTVLTAYRNYMKDGYVQKREKITVKAKNHICSLKDAFMPWYTLYSIDDNNQTGRLAISENLKITQTK